jgi:hypothetical protein
MQLLPPCASHDCPIPEQTDVSPLRRRDPKHNLTLKGDLVAHDGLGCAASGRETETPRVAQQIVRCEAMPFFQRIVDHFFVVSQLPIEDLFSQDVKIADPEQVLV